MRKETVKDTLLIVDEYGYVYEDGDSFSLVNLKGVEREYPWLREEPEVVGTTYEIDVARILHSRLYEDIREMLNNDGFIFKVEYNAARAYLDRMKATQARDDDYFRELL